MAKAESFIKGTIILAVAALVARVLGLAQRVPLEHLLGFTGDAAFSIANNVYLMLLAVATAGIPSTLSKMVSERYALGRPHEAQRIYYAALLFAGAAGVVMTLLLYFGAPYYAMLSKEPAAALSLQAIAPSLLLFPAIAMMRGYFQGRNMMIAGGVSQIVEQFARVFTAILLAYLLVRIGYGDVEVAAAASFGSVLGSIGAFVVMIYFTLKLRKQDAANRLEVRADGEAVIPLSRIYKDIFKLSIPIVIASLTIPAVNIIDSTIIKPLLIDQVGNLAATASLGILGQRAQSIAGIPPILAIALSTSLIPIISAAYARKEQENLQKQMTLALRISVLTGVPIVLMLATAAYCINGLLFSSRDSVGADAPSIIALLTICTIFQITMMTSNSMLIGINKVNRSMVHVLAGIALKLVLSLVLSQFLGIYGIIAATGLCFVLITILNLRSLHQVVNFSVLGSRWPGFLVTVVVLALVGLGLNQAGIGLTAWMNDRVAFFIGCCMVGIATLIVYPVMLVILRVVRAEELSSYPKPLRKLLTPLMRLQSRKA
ncbi:putative polysaccharide biosynthesis protein [Paenibacillus shenyangensis]|uniref:putative polysaccharide biosynthesis protein n=1 Tax=Paenibacillus sp. A9 TaxID=1284352 RepID=UPI00036230B6|nr:polysaccharide biosynthesis protein [Paenibacillus sp. A9]